MFISCFGVSARAVFRAELGSLSKHEFFYFPASCNFTFWIPTLNFRLVFDMADTSGQAKVVSRHAYPVPGKLKFSSVKPCSSFRRLFAEDITLFMPQVLLQF